MRSSMGLFIVRPILIVWWVNLIKADSTFSVFINGTTTLEKLKNLHIYCTITGFEEYHFLQFTIEMLLRNSDNITMPARITTLKGNGSNTKYEWTTFFSRNDIPQKNRIIVKLTVMNASNLDEGIYTCYATINSVTRYRHISLPADKAMNSSSYVILRSTDILPKGIPDACCKYGYTIFEDESFFNDNNLQENETVHFPVWPIFHINNKSVAMFKPWLSYEGCYNITTNITSEKMNCTKISVTEWTNKTDALPLIGTMMDGFCVLLEQFNKPSYKVPYSYCLGLESQSDPNVYIKLYSIVDKDIKKVDKLQMNTECEAAYIDINSSKLYEISCHGSSRCEAFCLNHDGSNASSHGHIKWENAKNICNNLNTSLPGIHSTFLTKERERIINMTVCLEVVRNSSVAFLPVIKQLTRKNEEIITYVIPDNGNQKLPFVCKDSKGNGETIPIVCNSKISTGKIEEYPIISIQNASVEGTPNEATTDVSINPKSRTEEPSIKPVIIIAPSVVASLMVLIVVCFIIRKRFSQRQRQDETKEEVTTKAYTPPSKKINEERRTRSDEDIHLEAMYSTAEETGHIKGCSEDVDKEGTTDEDLDEYDVLRGKRQKEDLSPGENIYDRTNNVVSGLYDVTTRKLDENEYSK